MYYTVRTFRNSFLVGVLSYRAAMVLAALIGAGLRKDGMLDDAPESTRRAPARRARPAASAGRPRRSGADGPGSREDILRVATEEFASAGLSGARVDAIAERTRTSKRMIYYHFGSKEGLYLAVLERAYGAIRSVENAEVFSTREPVEAIRRLVELTFDYDEAHPEFVRLVCIENIHAARHMKGSATLRSLNVSVIDALGRILERGHRDGVFRGGLDPIDIHMLISAFCFFRISNQHTFGVIFDRDLTAPALQARHKALIVEAVLAYLRPTPRPPASSG